MIDDLTKKRWHKDTNPTKHDPETALHFALLDVQEQKPDHVIVMMAKTEPDGCVSYRHIQAGKYDDFAQIGMIMQILHSNWLR